jgi:thiol:disulfide interchange protein DsbA
MKRCFRRLLVAVALLIAGNTFAAVQGRDYTLLEPAQPVNTKKIEVLEFFFYECPHCFHLHNELIGWEKKMPVDVDLKFVPTIFRASTEPLARTFFALSAMGKIQQLDDDIYQAIHIKQMNLFDLASITAFVASKGVDKDKFVADYNSFTINSEVIRARQMIRSYNIEGTPTIIVDGKYKLTGMQPADTVRVLDEVIDMVRKARATSARKH